MPTIGDPKWYRECKSLFPCGSPLESTAGLGRQALRQCRQGEAAAEGGGLRRHADRADAATDIAVLTEPRAGRQAAAGEGRLQGRPAGDGLADAGRAPRQEGPAVGRRLARLPHLLGRRPTSSTRSRPSYLNASCDKATFGWPCDAEIEKLRDAFAKETDPAKQKAIAEAVQLPRRRGRRRTSSSASTSAPVAYRKNVIRRAGRAEHRRSGTSRSDERHRLPNGRGRVRVARPGEGRADLRIGATPAPGRLALDLSLRERWSSHAELHPAPACGDDPGDADRRGAGVPDAAADAGRPGGDHRRRQRQHRADRRRSATRLGLDQPIVVQFVIWLGNILQRRSRRDRSSSRRPSPS